MRINQYLALCGLGSRRSCEKYILDQRVRIDGVLAEIGSSVSAGAKVTLDGKKIQPKEKKYYKFHKPRFVVTSMKDEQNRTDISAFLKNNPHGLFPVGRLDYLSTGLLILTNDGDFAQKMMHPKFHIEKEYWVKVSRPLTEEEMAQMESGIFLKEGKTAPLKIKILGTKKYSLTLTQGWNRQIRRMFEVFGIYVKSIFRIRIGNITLDYMPEGSLKEISLEDLKKKLPKLF